MWADAFRSTRGTPKSQGLLPLSFPSCVPLRVARSQIRVNIGRSSICTRGLLPSKAVVLTPGKHMGQWVCPFPGMRKYAWWCLRLGVVPFSSLGRVFCLLESLWRTTVAPVRHFGDLVQLLKARPPVWRQAMQPLIQGPDKVSINVAISAWGQGARILLGPASWSQ